MTVEFNDDSREPQITDHDQESKTFMYCGVPITKEDLDELHADLAKIAEAQRKAFDAARFIIIH